jgi:sterol desaturase/sphingolipid hydroxylase (fatty acid hydroxylase superfamily)
MNLFLFFVVYPFFYSFLEWTVHRMLHLFWSRRHIEHHIVLWSDDDYRASLKKSVNCFLIALPLFFLEGNLISLWINYTMYEFFHSWLHRNKSRAAVYHIIHHLSSDWGKNYGVLSPFWDRAFGTLRSARKIEEWRFLYNWNPYFFLVNF